MERTREYVRRRAEGYATKEITRRLRRPMPQEMPVARQPA